MKHILKKPLKETTKFKQQVSAYDSEGCSWCTFSSCNGCGFICTVCAYTR